jgi:hypothetical protein
VRFQHLFALIFALGGTAGAQVLSGKGAEWPLAVVVTPHFSVIHQPRLEGYARRVAAHAEAIRERVLGAVGNDPGRTFILVGDETDVFNGYAVPSPYPFIRVYATFPRPNDIGTQWESAIRVLVGHEFVHVSHLTTRDGSRNTIRSVFGNVPGLGDARTAPAWFIEGYAVYLETELTRGGRSRDATVTTLRAQMARGETWPSLSDASIGPLERWPFGNTRYTFGAGFVPFLIERYGEAGIRRVIATFNLGGFDFSEAWYAALGSRLEPLWDEWTRRERARASAELKLLEATNLSAGKPFAPGTSPAWRDDNVLAYRSGTTVRVVSNDGQPVGFGSRTLVSRPDRLSWAKDGSLVYSRITTYSNREIGEVYRLQPDGTEIRLTQDARARDAVADGDCVLYVQDVLETSRLIRRCGDQPETVFNAPEGTHLMQPAPRRDGRIALTVWRPGGFLDIAILESGLESGQLKFVTSDAAQDQFPGWTDDGQLVFTSDRAGSFQAYRAVAWTDSSVRLEPLTAAPGGVYALSPANDGRLVFGSYTASGIEVRIAENTVGNAINANHTVPDGVPDALGLAYPVEPYAPNLAPIFWLPVTPNGLGATVYGADAAGIHNWSISAGVAPTFAPNGTVGIAPDLAASYSFAPSLDWRFDLSATWDAFGPRARASATTAGDTEVGLFGIGLTKYRLTPHVGLDAQGVFGGASFNLETLRTDPFGYATSGWQFTGFVNSRLAFLGQFSLNVSPFDLPLEATLRAYPEPGTKFTTGDVRIASRFTVRPSWRLGDGIHSLERFTFRPFVQVARLGLGGSYGGGVQAFLDTYLSYYAPISFGLEFAYDSFYGFRVVFVGSIPLLNGLLSTPTNNSSHNNSFWRIP